MFANPAASWYHTNPRWQITVAQGLMANRHPGQQNEPGCEWGSEKMANL
jgi:hypothetical protein